MPFGSVPSRTEGRTQAIAITDTGNEDMTITSATLGGANPGDFLIKSGVTGNQTVTNGGGTASWTIDCKPTARGAPLSDVHGRQQLGEHAELRRQPHVHRHGARTWSRT